MTQFLFSYTALWLLVLLQFLLCVGLMKEVGRLRGMVPEDRIPIGDKAPVFTGVDLRSGLYVRSRALFRARLSVLLLFHSSCSLCVALADDLRRNNASEFFPIVAVCSQDEGCGKFLSLLDPQVRIIAPTDADINGLFGIAGSPAAVLIDGDGYIRGYGRPRTFPELRSFVATTSPKVTVPRNETADARWNLDS